MSKETVTVQTLEIHSTQDWTCDPDMIEVSVSRDLIEKAEKCFLFMQEHGVAKSTIENAFSYQLYQSSANCTDDELTNLQIVAGPAGSYVSFKPSYPIVWCHAVLCANGELQAHFPISNNGREFLTCVVGTLFDLRKQLGLGDASTAALQHWAVTGRIPGDAEDVLGLYHVSSREAALAEFEAELWEGRPDSEKDAVFNAHGQLVFVTSIMASATPIYQG